MARFSTAATSLVAIVLVAVMASQMTHVAYGQGTPGSCTNQTNCGICADPQRVECCDGYKWGVADDGKTYAYTLGKCTCCEAGQTCNVAYSEVTDGDSGASAPGLTIVAAYLQACGNPASGSGAGAGKKA